MGECKSMTKEELNILSKIKVRPLEEQRDFLLEQNILLTGKMATLEKENAELKGLKDVATLIRANNDTVTTLMQLNNMLVSKSQQLTKAKEIIKQFLSYEQIPRDCLRERYRKLLEEAEQVISEVEK